MKIAVTTPILNEEKLVERYLKSLLIQTRSPDEIIIVDDGSKDNTGKIIKKYVKKSRIIKYIYQKNKGPASARNKAWRSSKSDICIFTDGDCVAEPNWIEELIKPFREENVGATGGTYKTINSKNLLAKFIGEEISWKYRNVKGEIDIHGSYNLAVRKRLLEEIGGFNESYPKPSGEDWDLTHKISKKYKIIFVPTAVVGTEHFEKILPYMKNQVRRGFDRIRFYNDFPEKAGRDVYTGKIVKFQILASLIFFPSLISLLSIFKFSFIIPLIIFLFLFVTTLLPFSYFFTKDPILAFYSIPIILIRNFAWALGTIKGIFAFGFKNVIKGILVIK